MTVSLAPRRLRQGLSLQFYASLNKIPISASGKSQVCRIPAWNKGTARDAVQCFQPQELCLLDPRETSRPGMQVLEMALM